MDKLGTSKTYSQQERSAALAVWKHFAASEGCKNWFFQHSILSCALVGNWTHISWMGGKNSATKPPVLSHKCLPSASPGRVTGKMLQSQIKKSVYTGLFIQNAGQSPKSTPRTEVCIGDLGQETPSRCGIQIKILDSFPHLGCILFALLWLGAFQTLSPHSWDKHQFFPKQAFWTQRQFGRLKIWRCAWVTSEDLNDN